MSLLDDLKVDQNYEELGENKLLVDVPITKPNRQWWVRCHPSAEYRMAASVFVDTRDRTFYRVAGGVRQELENEMKAVELITSITRQGELFIWPITLPPPDKADNPWNKTAREAARRAEDQWVSVRSNTNRGAYDIVTPEHPPTDPSWPSFEFEDLLERAFKGNHISSIDHPIIKNLRGAFNG
jgi:hypothetical protein